MSTATTIPEVIDALVAAARRALSDDVQVIDGPPLTDLEQDVVDIGFTVDRLPVEGSQELAGLGRSRQETYDVVCLASAASGDSDQETLSVLRKRARGFIDTLAGELAHDVRLGGLVMNLRIGALIALDQSQARGAGATATFEFTVHVTAMT